MNPSFFYTFHLSSPGYSGLMFIDSMASDNLNTPHYQKAKKTQGPASLKPPQIKMRADTETMTRHITRHSAWRPPNVHVHIYPYICMPTCTYTHTHSRHHTEHHAKRHANAPVPRHALHHSNAPPHVRHHPTTETLMWPGAMYYFCKPNVGVI